MVDVGVAPRQDPWCEEHYPSTEGDECASTVALPKRCDDRERLPDASTLRRRSIFRLQCSTEAEPKC